MEFIIIILFVIVQIIFIPLAMLGSLLIFYSKIQIRKKLSVSATAINVINGQWIMDIFGIRKDTAAVNLNEVLQSTSVIGLWLMHFPLYMLYRITGKNIIFPAIASEGKEAPRNLAVSRTLYIDKILNRLKSNAEQFVVINAGIGTRCYSMFHNSGLQLFELDLPEIQKEKLKMLADANVDTNAVTYIPINLHIDDWFSILIDSGFDLNKKTIFLWEGASKYLWEGDIRNIIGEIKANASEGSSIICDFYSQQYLSGEYRNWTKPAKKELDITEDTLGFGLDFSLDYENTLKLFVESEGAKIGETYFLGNKTIRGTFMAVVEIIV